MMVSKGLGLAAAAVIAIGTLSGCAAIERETGFGPKAQIGGAGGAAAGGLIAAAAGASPLWIAGSTILGGLTGGAIGDSLEE